MPEHKGGAPRGKRHGTPGGGSVYKETVSRTDGSTRVRWIAALTIAPGKKQRVTAPTQREARAKLKAMLAEQAKGTPRVSERQTVGEYLDWWLEHSFRGKPTSRVAYEVSIRVHLKPVLGDIQMTELRAEDVERFIANMRARGYAAATINNARAILRVALGLALKRERITRNAAALVDPIRREVEEPEPLSGEECQVWIAKLRPHRLGALWVTAIATGLRVGELCGLRWSDVDLEHAKITVRQQAQKIDGVQTFVTPKSRTSRRTVPIPTFLVDILTEHRRQQQLARIAMGDDWVDLDLVFPTWRGQINRGGDVWRAFVRALKAAGLPAHPFHYLRHVYASLLLSLGIHPWVASELLGHADTRITRRYTHIHDATKQAAIDQLDALLQDQFKPREPKSVSV